jgi:hypothetical protein
MGRIPVPSGSSFYSRFANIRLFVGDRKAEESPTSVPEESETMDVRDESLDAVAGSEFVDDLIREE